MDTVSYLTINGETREIADYNMRQDINTIQNDLNGVKTSTVYNTTHATVDARFESDESRIKALRDEVDAAHSSTVNKTGTQTAATYSNLDARFESDESRIKALRDEVDAAHSSTVNKTGTQTAATYSNLDARFEADETKIKNAADEIAAAHRTSSDTLDARFDNIESRATSVENEISAAHSSTQISGGQYESLDARLDAIDSRITTVTTTPASDAHAQEILDARRQRSTGTAANSLLTRLDNDYDKLSGEIDNIDSNLNNLENNCFRSMYKLHIINNTVPNNAADTINNFIYIKSDNDLTGWRFTQIYHFDSYDHYMRIMLNNKGLVLTYDPATGENSGYYLADNIYVVVKYDWDNHINSNLNLNRSYSQSWLEFVKNDTQDLDKYKIDSNINFYLKDKGLKLLNTYTKPELEFVKKIKNFYCINGNPSVLNGLRFTVVLYSNDSNGYFYGIKLYDKDTPTVDISFSVYASKKYTIFTYSSASFLIELDFSNVPSNAVTILNHAWSKCGIEIQDIPLRNFSIEESLKKFEFFNHIQEDIINKTNCLITYNSTSIESLSTEYGFIDKNGFVGGVYSQSDSSGFRCIKYPIYKDHIYRFYGYTVTNSAGINYILASVTFNDIINIPWLTGSSSGLEYSEIISPQWDGYIYTWYQCDRNDKPLCEEITGYLIEQKASTDSQKIEALKTSFNGQWVYNATLLSPQASQYAFIQYPTGIPSSTFGTVYQCYKYELTAGTTYHLYGGGRTPYAGTAYCLSSFYDIVTSSYTIVVVGQDSDSFTFDQFFTPVHSGILYYWLNVNQNTTFNVEVTTGIKSLDIDFNNLVPTLRKKEKIAFVGDSVTWGDGALSTGYLQIIENLFYNNNNLITEPETVTGTVSSINNPKFLKKTAKMLSGVDTEISFKLFGDELILYSAIPRVNTAAAIVELYINNTLYDTFSTYNNNENGSETKTFTGDGTTVSFPLGRCFTYNPTVTVDGTTMTGGLNISGYGASITDDYLIIRKYIDGKVQHTLRFKTAPANGATIICSYDYGESICYEGCTIGERGTNLDSNVESYYGDGTIAFDPAAATGFSSGLDFRYVNPKAKRIYKFTSKANRKFNIKIKEADPRATTTPIYVFNGAANIEYDYMNAGIGGFKYRDFNSSQSLTSYKYFMNYEPEKIFVMLGTNDDWGDSGYPCYQTRTVDSNWINENSYYWSNGITTSGSGYSVQDRWVDISAVTKNSVTFSNSVTFVSVGLSKNDILIFNKYGTDEKYCQIRLVDTYSDGVATFKKPLDMTNIDTNTKVLVKRLTTLGTNIDAFFTNIESYDYIKPKIYIGCMGVPNYYARQLLGYKDYLRMKAAEHGYEFIDLFTSTSDFESSVKRTLTYTITSDGSTSYVVSNSINPLLKNVSVKVDGIEIYDGKNVRICGGWGTYYKNNLNGYETVLKPTLLKLTTPIESGKTIIITGSTEAWSSDYCHMSLDAGKYIYGTTIANKIFD